MPSALIPNYSSRDLKDRRWKDLRHRLAQECEWKCETCDKETSHLQIHHTEYVEGRQAWEYEDETLMVLCIGCHVKMHWQEGTYDER